ncbi:unnamed protein product, partial [Medioppia subpectinata]
SNFSVKEVAQTLNGINTQGENIADNGGVIQSYRAYQKYVLENGAEPQLPAIDLSPEQLFWVSSAVQYCSKATKQYLALQVVTDSHSPSRQRVNGVVSNSDEFSKVFNCPSGAPMNPVNKIIQSLDESVSPCDDFYQFTCGQWMASTPIPDDKSSLNSFNELQEVINYRIKDLLDDSEIKERANNDLDFIQKAKDYYQSCMNTSELFISGNYIMTKIIQMDISITIKKYTLIEERGSEPLLDLLDQIIGQNEWPLPLGSADNTSVAIGWQELYLKLRDFGLINTMLFSLSVSTDVRNNTRKVLSLDQPSFGLNRDLLVNEETGSSYVAYRDLMIKSGLKLMKYNTNVSQIETTIDSILAFERQLANISMAKELRRNLTVILYEDKMDFDFDITDDISLDSSTHREERDYLKSIDWLKIIAHFVGDNITDTDEIILNDTSFIHRLNQLVNDTDNGFNIEWIRLLVNYMVWRVILSKHMSLSEEWTQMRRQFEQVIHGTASPRPRWYQCVKAVDNAMTLLVSHLYVRHYFRPQIKQKASELIESVRLEFKHTLTEMDWLDNQTLERALDKLARMRIVVGYPDDILNSTAVDSIYSGLSVNASDFFGNILTITQWKQNLSFQSLNKLNDINDHGRHFDGDGNLNYWWAGNTDQRYRQKAKCFVQQYGEYHVNGVGLTVNGARTQAENIADNGGIKLAFKAYRAFVKERGPELPLPALPYTTDQLLWISYGVHYCAKHNTESLRNLILNDSHTPKQYRINGALSNSDDFSRVFNCPFGTPMNPMAKCSYLRHYKCYQQQCYLKYHQGNRQQFASWPVYPTPAPVSDCPTNPFPLACV